MEKTQDFSRFSGLELYVSWIFSRFSLFTDAKQKKKIVFISCTTVRTHIDVYHGTFYEYL